MSTRYSIGALCAYCKTARIIKRRVCHCGGRACRDAHTREIQRRVRTRRKEDQRAALVYARSIVPSPGTVTRRQEGIRFMLDDSFRGFAAKTGRGGT